MSFLKSQCHISGFTLLTLIASFSAVAQPQTTVNAQVWADNWFALYVDGELVKEDSEALERERSFNVEVFSFDAQLPAQISVLVKDYKEGDSGLEYIGSRRQKMGDGGFIAQFYQSTSDELLAVTSSDWLCKVIHQAPLNASECERSSNPDQDCLSHIEQAPANWETADFDDSGWPAAVEHSAQAVRPHGGYDNYSWEPSAQLIWTEDLQVDNSLLCRFTLSAN